MRANNDNGAFGLPEFKTGKNATTVKTVSYLQPKQAERPINHKDGILNKFTHVRPNDLCKDSKMTM